MCSRADINSLWLLHKLVYLPATCNSEDSKSVLLSVANALGK